MANAFISGRRYPTGGGAAIPAGHQSFTANGTFTAPYTGVYTVVLTAGHAASGIGGQGGNGDYGITSEGWRRRYGGAGGGAGGSAYLANSPGIIVIKLNKNQSVTVTVNVALCSFGNYASFATGTNPGNGNPGGRPDASEEVIAVGGSGGSGGGKPVFSFDDALVLFAVVPSLPYYNLSGGNGQNGGSPNSNYGGPAGIPANNIPCISGQMGGFGQICTNDTGTQTQYFNVGVVPSDSKIPAAAGRIDITWGNQ